MCPMFPKASQLGQPGFKHHHAGQIEVSLILVRCFREGKKGILVVLRGVM